jgi:hypothetical protein
MSNLTKYHQQFIGVDMVHKHNYRKLIDSINLILYDLAHSICIGCTHIDSTTDVCSIFSFTYKNYCTTLYQDKIKLNECPCSTCIVKMKCDRICNDFTEFYTDHRFKLTNKRYDQTSVKQALNIIISVNKQNKKNNDYVLEIKGLNIDRLTEDDKDDMFITHNMQMTMGR